MSSKYPYSSPFSRRVFFQFPLCSLASILSRNLVSHKGKEDDAARRRGARVSDIFVTISRCRVPDYPAPRGELFLRRDSTRAALSRLSRPSKKNIKLVLAAFTTPACAARDATRVNRYYVHSSEPPPPLIRATEPRGIGGARCRSEPSCPTCNRFYCPPRKRFILHREL